MHVKQNVLIICLILAAILCGCARIIHRPPEATAALEKLQVSEYPEFVDDTNYLNLADSIHQSLLYLKNKPSGMKFKFGNDLYETSHMVDSLEKFQAFISNKPTGDELKQFIRDKYYIYKSTGNNGNGEVLFTGYYEPVLEGNLSKNDTYKHPVFGTPSDLISIDLSLFSAKYAGEKITGRYTGQTVIPYYDRKEIETGGVLDGKAPVLAWVKDPVDLFFLQIQGSGKIILENGHPYKSIGRLLIEKGTIPRSEMSMQMIREYLSANPGQIDDILNYNPSYVFFKTEKEGPLGYLEVRLIPERSIALDRRIFPLAGLVFIETVKPVIDENGNLQEWLKSKKFVLNHDTGGAIRGPGRADIFWGNGKYAETAAGNMQHKGSLYFLILKPYPNND